MQSLKTFIVEDSPIILESLVATLQEFAAAEVVGTAADESSAVGWLNQSGNHCDLVIIDIFLKSGSGIGVLRTAAKSRAAGKCIVLTNYATDDMRTLCTSLGADRVFDKSRELDELLAYCVRISEGGDSRPGALQ